MKKNTLLLLVGVVVGLCLMTVSLMAETISKTGVSQKSLVSFLTNVATLGNEVKSDHNALFTNYTGLRTALLTDKNYSTARHNVRLRSNPTAATSAADLSLSGH